MSVSTYTALGTQISTNLADNTGGDISASDVRGVVNDLLDYQTVYGGIYVVGGSTAQGLTTTPAKLTCWAGDGAANGTVPDHTSDLITISTNADGVYEVHFNISATGNAGTIFIFKLYKNAAAVTGYQCRLTGAATPTATGLSALVTGVVATDTFSVFGETNTGSVNLTPIDAQLNVKRIK